MHILLIVLWMLICGITPSAAQVSIGIGLPGVSIGINLPVYPELVPVPGYPVYYAPQMNSNYFFYDGLYWVYQRDNWYASSWYNGPWGLVVPEAVPLFVLRVPVRYYRHPPAYFRGWRGDAPPRWGDHWGNAWAQNRSGWDNWNRSSIPAPAPLPAYQRQYSGNRYPHLEQQQMLQTQNYRYQPQDAVVQQHYQAQRVQSAPAPAPQVKQAGPQQRTTSQQDQRGTGRPSSLPQAAPPAPRGQPPQKGGGDVQKPAAAQAPVKKGGPSTQHPGQQSPQGAAQREQQAPKSQGQDQGPQGKGTAQESKQGRGKGQEKGEQQGGEHNK